MEWSELRDRYDPLNQHVNLPLDSKQRIRERLHAEISRRETHDGDCSRLNVNDRNRSGHNVNDSKTVVHRRRHRRAVTAGSLSAALVAAICIAAVIDYSGPNGAVGYGPFQWIHNFAPHGASGGTSSSSSPVSAGATSGPAKGLTQDGTTSVASQSGKGPASTASQSAQGPSSTASQSVQGPSSTASQSVQGPVSTASQSGQGPSSTASQSGQGPASTASQSGQGPSSTASQSVQGPSSTASQSVQGPSSTASQSAQGPSSTASQSAQSGAGVSNGVVNGLAPVPAPGLQLTADNPLQMFGVDGWMWTGSELLHTRDGGVQWDKVNLPVTVKPYSEVVTVLNAASVRVAVGIVSHRQASVEVLRSQDGGVSWQKSYIKENLPGQSSGQVPASMMFVGETNGWMTTNVPQFGMGAVSPGGLYRTTNGAESWQQVQPIGFPEGLVPFEWVSFVTPQIGFTVAAPQTNADAGVTNGQYRLYRSADGGVHWSQASVPLLKADSVNILAPQFSGSTGYLEAVVTNQNTASLVLFKSTDMGTKWHQVHIFPGQSASTAVLSVSQQAVWVYWDKGLWVSHNQGGSFSPVPNAPSRVTGLDMVDAVTGYAVTAVPLSGTAGEAHVVYETKDGGRTWTKVSTAT